TELIGRVSTLEQELSAVETERHGQQGIVESLAEQVEETQARQAALRQQVIDIRRTDEEARGRENELTRQLARLDADAVGADARAQDATSRLEQLIVEQREL